MDKELLQSWHGRLLPLVKNGDLVAQAAQGSTR
jgi:hypothetical protein